MGFKRDIDDDVQVKKQNTECLNSFKGAVKDRNGKYIDAKVFKALKAVKLSKRLRLKEEIGHSPLFAPGRSEGQGDQDLSGGTAQTKLRNPLFVPRNVHSISRVASTIGNFATGIKGVIDAKEMSVAVDDFKNSGNLKSIVINFSIEDVKKIEERFKMHGTDILKINLD
ncbi:hypothetical protein EVAR_60292_1 [Eumeta japonica]|uniref:Uncharacterized protein n=1 Tax=Eumeta variegata TaxID=151549 RepID=A0A4C1Z4F3_EUMVA|nr:hypothetical protein EVAR_60292_1 [Eumeta japonica]